MNCKQENARMNSEKEKTLEASLERSSEKAFWEEGFWKGTLPDNGSQNEF